MFAKNPDVIETDLSDELVLLDPTSRQMFSLNATGRALWQALPLSSVTEAGAVLSESFDVTSDVAARDAEALLSELVASGLVRTT